MAALYTKDHYLSNEFDRDTYNEIYRDNKKLFAKASTSSYFEGGKTDTPVNYFDLVDSDISAASRIFRVFDKDSSKILREMLKADEERAEAAIIKYINTVHENGRRKAQFVSMYSRLKDIIDDEGKSLNIMKLDKKVQSYILLDILT